MDINYNKFKAVCKILDKFCFEKSKLIPILQAIQKEYMYLPKEILIFIASSLDISLTEIYGVVTFFTYFTLLPRGKNIIKICNGTACHVKKSTNIIKVVREKLKLKEHEILTNDMCFTVETVACLGACGLAPVVVINEEVYGQITPNKIITLIDEIKDGGI
ncbi:MAG: NAD(P)H-dependent oxidoreductase subunit E [Endomicrobium sp.]|jgi:NADH-quinone oxidoreductase subunit E|nr:NAD(P)H-dependent oxidoreductase subunit E [Endomicrobium sp.]